MAKVLIFSLLISKRLFKKLFLYFLLISIAGRAQNNPNIGFEDGTFNKWQCLSGVVDPVGNIDVIPVSPLPYRQTIIGNTGGLDPYGNFPMHCPNGSKYSAKLGSANQGTNADRLAYTLIVPSGGAYNILFNYAIVLADPQDHLPNQQPRFTAKVFDVTDSVYIDCPSFDFVAGTNLPGYSFKLSDLQAPNTPYVYYKDWSTAIVDLTKYHGKTVRLEFTTNNCVFGGHFGYAYIDVQDNLQAITGNAYCQGQNSVTLYGPAGFSDYYWYNADLSTKIGEGQNITLSPAPANLTQYALRVFPYPGLGCIDTLYTVVNKIDEGFKLSVVSTVFGCKGGTVDLTLPSITSGSSDGVSLSYFKDSLATVNLYNPNAVDTAGTYYIKGINAGGCMNILPVQVSFRAPAIDIVQPAAVTFPATIDLTKTFVPAPGLSYEFYSDAKAVDKLAGYTTINYSGTFYIKATDQNGCSTVAPVTVTITKPPPPPYTITADNAFTPNGDNINDYFFITVKGSVTFKNLQIFNRYGQLVFNAKSISQQWDGKYNGNNLPAGTYYWVFEGIYDYDNTKINKSGSITLIR